MKVESNLPRKILERLYNDYYPEPCLKLKLCEALSMKGREQSVLAAGRYLKDKGLIAESAIKDEGRAWTITPEGIESLEGKSLI